MISNISKSSHSGFARLAKYTLGKEKSCYLGGNVAYCDPFSMPELPTNITHSRANPSDIAKNFWLTPGLSSCEKPCCHISLALPPQEHDLEDEEWVSLCRDYLSQMGFDLAENQYFIVKHEDRDHPHIHIVANRVGVVSGDVVSDSHDYYRSQVVLRELEQKYGLEATPSSWEQPHKLPIHCKDGEALQEKVDRAIKSLFSQRLTPTLGNLGQVLFEEEGVGLLVESSNSGKGHGDGFYVRYIIDGTKDFAGYELGQSYRLQGLARKGLRFDPQIDIQELSQIPSKVGRLESVAQPMLDIWRILALEKKSRVNGQNYIFSLTEELAEDPMDGSKQSSVFRFSVHQRTAPEIPDIPVLTLRSTELFPKKEPVAYRVSDINLSDKEVGASSAFLANVEHIRKLMKATHNQKSKPVKRKRTSMPTLDHD